jgi:transcriptional regulator with XRE-family HTH domain
VHDLHAAAGEETIGARIRRLRLERGLSQRELSGPGVSYAYVSRIEAGQRDPSLKALRVLARRLGVSLEHLETGVPVTEAQERELRLGDAELELRLGDDLRAAEESFRALLVDARESGDVVAEARARAGLGVALARLGDTREAVAQLERVLDSEAVAPELRPDAYAALARLYRELGAPQRAVQLLERNLEELTGRAPEDAASAALYATYLSQALDARGDAASARIALLDAKERLEAVGDVHGRIRLYWSRARAASEEGRFARALAYLRRAVALAEANAIASLGYLVVAGAMALAGALALGWRAALLVPVVVLPAAFLAGRRAPLGRGGPVPVAPVSGRLPGGFWAIAALIFFGTAADWCMSSWGASFVHEATGASVDAAVAVMAAYFGGMVAGRAAGSALAHRLRPQRVLAVGLVCSAAGFALLWPAGSPALAAAGLALSGFGNGNLYPMAVALALAAAPERAALAGGRAVTVAATAVVLLPLALGRLADAIGLTAALAVVPACLALAAAALTAVGRTALRPAI